MFFLKNYLKKETNLIILIDKPNKKIKDITYKSYENDVINKFK